MNNTFDNLKELLVLTIRSPRQGARVILDLPASPDQVWGAFIAMILLSVVMTGLSNILFPVPQDQMLALVQLTPFKAAALLGVITFALTAAVVAIGKVLGGVGSLSGGLRLISWLQAILIAIQAVQFLCLALLPPLALLLGLASIVLFVWLLINFVTELHRFPGIGTSIVVIVLAFTLASFVLLSMVSTFGLIPPLEASHV